MYKILIIFTLLFTSLSFAKDADLSFNAEYRIVVHNQGTFDLMELEARLRRIVGEQGTVLLVSVDPAEKPPSLRNRGLREINLE